MGDPTLLIHWLFSSFALLIIFTRLLWRKIAGQMYNTGDYLSMGAALCVLARGAIIHVVLVWGTANVSRSYRQNHVFLSDEIYRRTVGSQLALVNRVFYNSYLWLQKLVLLDVYRRLIKNLWYERVCIWTYLAVFFATYAAIQISTFTECKPIELYWQVVPDPGVCVRAEVQLFVVAIANVATDAMLLVLPLPVVFSMHTATWRRRAQLLVLFSLGIFIILITLVRLPINSSHPDSQVSRTSWASTELLAAAFVVNAPTLWGLWNKRRQEANYGKEGGGAGAGGSGGHNIITIGSGASSRSGGKPDRPAANRGSGVGRFYGHDGGATELAELGANTNDSRELVLGVGNTSTVERGPERDEDEERDLEPSAAADPGLRRQPSMRDGITRTMEVIVTTEVGSGLSAKPSLQDITRR